MTDEVYRTSVHGGEAARASHPQVILAGTGVTGAGNSSAGSDPEPMPHIEHRSRGPAAVRFMVVTVSDSRCAETDDSGRIICRLLTEAGHAVTQWRIVRDEPLEVAAVVREGVSIPMVDVVVLNGGTGISSRDVTFETLLAMIEKPIPGFGELFRMLSFQQVGSAAMLSRATAGLVGGKAVFSIPGSPRAAELAITRLILPEACHIVAETSR